MNMSYNIDEIFEIAEQIERNGGIFYRRAAELVDSPAARKLFNDLAAKEDEHLDTFSKMRKELVPAETSIAIYDKDEIVAIYLQALAGKEVFNKTETAEDLLTGSESPADILTTAIGKERDSIIFYAAARSLMNDDKDRNKIEEIIREEQKHVELLTKNLQELQG